MSKLDIIYNIPNIENESPKLILLMENHTIELLNFAQLQNQERFIELNELVNSMYICRHEFVFIKNCQTRAADEAFTSVYQCKKCKYQKCRS